MKFIMHINGQSFRHPEQKVLDESGFTSRTSYIASPLNKQKIFSSCLQTCLTGQDAYCPNFHSEWSSSCLQDLANQTLLPLALPNCTANNFHCDWARWANQATQARQLFSSFCPRGLRHTGTAFLPSAGGRSINGSASFFDLVRWMQWRWDYLFIAFL